jgi:hypothetical protein
MLGFQIVEGIGIFRPFTGKCCFCFPSSLNFSDEIYSTKLLLICKNPIHLHSIHGRAV